ncbi:hypothetical protein L873DRAFT_1662752 [Choiromyces venosus 120613-1]|uniref:Mid2 domain-containing protein n=1 Tax=Choiromyces venosus 120613-1 TaxID=1336337 RepID=A0A3N4K4S4_9PEZI|nr:hypothetical protein L873DRAFT_1662752 [Choiromyces venosus 120613-1]
MALRYLTTFFALLTTVLAEDCNDPSPLKDTNLLLLIPGILPAKPLLGQSNNLFEPLPFGIGGRLLRYVNIEKRVCGGSVLHSACPNDVTKCCPIDGDCCGGGICCEYGYVCQKNHLEKTVCCPKGQDCSVMVPNNPCAIATHTKCAGFDACCPPNKTCQIVGNGVSCLGPPSGSRSKVLANRAESSAPPVSGSTPCPNCNTPPVTSIPGNPPSGSSTPAQPPSSSTPAQPPSSSTPVQPPSSTPVQPPSSSTPVRPPSSTITPSTRPPSTATPRPPAPTTPTSTGKQGNTSPSSSTITRIQSPSIPAPSDGGSPSFVQTISQTGYEQAGTTVTGTLVPTQGTSVKNTHDSSFLQAPTSGDESKPSAPTTQVEVSTITSAVVTHGVTSFIEIPTTTTRVINPDFAETQTPTPTPAPTNTGSGGKSGPNAAVVAGASIGGTFLLAAIGFGIFLFVRKKNERKKRNPDMQGIFTAPPAREPTIPVLPPPPSSGAGGRGSTASPVSELSSSGVVAPVPRYGSMHVPPGVAELQEEAAARERNRASDCILSGKYTVRIAKRRTSTDAAGT